MPLLWVAAVGVRKSQVVGQHDTVANLLAAVAFTFEVLDRNAHAGASDGAIGKVGKNAQNTLPWVSVSTSEATPSHMVLTKLAPIASRVSTNRCMTTICLTVVLGG